MRRSRGKSKTPKETQYVKKNKDDEEKEVEDSV